MKLTKNNLKTLVKQVISESKVLQFPPPTDEESAESAQQSLDKDEDIIEFFEDNEADEGEEVLAEEDVEEDLLPSVGNVVGRAVGTATGIPMAGTVGSMVGGAAQDSIEADDPGQEEELSLQEIVQQEIAKALKK